MYLCKVIPILYLIGGVDMLQLVVSCHSDSLNSNLEEDQQGNLKYQVFLLEGND